eukprot:2267203-Alexandrium_andersonii.AAC.1
MVSSALDLARQSRDVDFIRPTIAAAQASSIPGDRWSDVAQLLSVLGREEDLGSGGGRSAEPSGASGSAVNRPH